MEQRRFGTAARCGMTDITGDVEQYLHARAADGIQDGFVCIYSPHTTCAVTINEGFDPDVQRDISTFLSKLVPENSGFRHSEGNSDAHVKVSLIGASCLVPVIGGRTALGQWQRVFLCEFDGPRTRTLYFSFIRAE
ncbi:MAG: secondary thiamine-phosphate synthase enzyme YjbQ [Desulfovibrionaceae bacterium]|nr:secondary thiamine-phosphate synthase enzyme YjbQ [Desulfovibrionaceae bacterium]